MSFTCQRCKEYKVLADTCYCKRFECAQPWQGAVSPCNFSPVWAYDAEAAAEKYAEECDQDGEYTILKNGSAEIWVQDADGVCTRWSIEAESEPQYHAHQLEFPAATPSGEIKP